MDDYPVKIPLFRAAGASFDVVAMAASAGGLHALAEVLSGLPDGFPAAVLVVQHLDPNHPSMLPEILARRTELKVRQARDGERLASGIVFIAPPDQHLLVDPDSRIALTRTALVHFVRPSADLLFESVAATYRDRSIAVVLTGTGRDGSMGAQAIEKMGGIVIAQDEQSSEFFGMPSAAIETGAVKFILPLKKIPTDLVALVHTGKVPE